MTVACSTQVSRLNQGVVLGGGNFRVQATKNKKKGGKGGRMMGECRSVDAARYTHPVGKLTSQRHTKVGWTKLDLARQASMSETMMVGWAPIAIRDTHRYDSVKSMASGTVNTNTSTRAQS